MERGKGTHPDRLIKKLGRKEIRTHTAANVFLQQEYLANHNQRFAREPAQPQDYHRRAPAARDLEPVFCLETDRRISNDWVVGYDNRYLQRERHSDYAPPQAKVSVCEWENGRIEIRYQGKARPYREIAAPEPQVPAAIALIVKPQHLSRWKPGAVHPLARIGAATGAGHEKITGFK